MNCKLTLLMVRNPATNTQINTNELKLKFVTHRAIRGKMKTFYFIKRCRTI
jgi:hypothetical protein